MTLKAARVNCGLTQSEACKRLGISVPTIINWEKGKTFPDAKQILMIQDVYGVCYDDLIFLPTDNALSVKEQNDQ
ncbi:MAG: helix-turn-helix transcriptional regulator [Oscillospiraceae bacterium]|nr:helix-turn-helix transcriptional regulator [Oscillospiraceae bacterium]